MKPWEGRFTGATDALMERFSSSIAIDWRLFRYDIEGSVAYAEMLGRIGILSGSETSGIVAALSGDSGRDRGAAASPSGTIWKISTCTSSRGSSKKWASLGKKLHTGRSRNEQVSLDTRMYVKEELARLDDDLKGAHGGDSNEGGSGKDGHHAGIHPYEEGPGSPLCPFSHGVLLCLQKGQGKGRRGTRRGADVMPLGSGALAGSTFRSTANS